MKFNQQLLLTLIDKAVIGGLLLFAAFIFNRLLEAFKSNQARQMELFKTGQLQQLETFKNQLAIKEDASRNVRQAVADFAKKIACGIHSICWLCWAAKNSPKEINDENLNNYDKEMHLLLNELVASRVYLAALNNDMQTTLSPIVDKLYKLDSEVGLAKARYFNSREEGLEALSKIHEPAMDLDDELIITVTNMVSVKQ